MRIERGFACDDEVLATGESPDQYAGHVVDVAASLLQQNETDAQNATPSCAIAMAGCSNLETRVRAIPLKQ